MDRLTIQEHTEFRQKLRAHCTAYGAEVCRLFDDILLTDARVHECLYRITYGLHGLDTWIRNWHAEDEEGAVTPTLLAQDWLWIKKHRPRQWAFVAYLRYPHAVRVLDDPEACGRALHALWERRTIHDTACVRAWLAGEPYERPSPEPADDVERLIKNHMGVVCVSIVLSTLLTLGLLWWIVHAVVIPDLQRGHATQTPITREITHVGRFPIAQMPESWGLQSPMDVWPHDMVFQLR